MISVLHQQTMLQKEFGQGGIQALGASQLLGKILAHNIYLKCG